MQITPFQAKFWLVQIQNNKPSFVIIAIWLKNRAIKIEKTGNFWVC